MEAPQHSVSWVFLKSCVALLMSDKYYMVVELDKTIGAYNIQSYLFLFIFFELSYLGFAYYIFIIF